ncbi:hypothetical protein Bca101_044768 [Brassica carinata]
MDPNTSTETMDAACPDPSKSLGKRKDEPLPEADPVDEEESGEEDMEEKKDSSESDQVWGFDSFEGDDYEYPDESPEDDDDREYRKYVRHYHETRGFKVDKEMIPKNLFQGLRGLNLDRYFFKPNLTGRDYMEVMVKVAIDKYNQTESSYADSDHIVRVVVRMSTGVKAYITFTFMAKETPEGELVEYQAKTERKAWQKNIHAIFCRPASNGKVDSHVGRGKNISEGLLTSNMNPGACMIDTVDCELEVMQDVEASRSDCIKLPTKRKAETSLVADPVEGEESRQEEQEEEKDSAESDQVWDVDSFDSDYESPSEEATDSDEFELRRYMRHLYESKGFLLEKGMVPRNLLQGWRRLNLNAFFKKPNLTGRDYMEIMAQVAIDKYNQTKGNDNESFISLQNENENVSGIDDVVELSNASFLTYGKED